MARERAGREWSVQETEWYRAFAWCLVVGILGILGAAAPMATEAVEETTAIPKEHISIVFTDTVRYWEADIVRWADKYGLDPNLVATVMQIESCGWPSAVSSSDAQGLFQVMPYHFDPRENMQDPEINADRGLEYLALGLTRAGGNVELALAGYNGGHEVIGKAPSLWSDQTRRYVYWGTGIYADASSGATESPRLEEWLKLATGMCARAAESLGLAK